MLVFACALYSLSIMDFLQSRQPLPTIQCLSCLQLETSLVTFDCNLCAFQLDEGLSLLWKEFRSM